MRRLVTVLALTGVLLTAIAGSALATVHPLVCFERYAAAANGTPTDTQDPPSITLGGVDRSSATTAQPVVAVFTAAGNGANATSAMKPEGC